MKVRSRFAWFRDKLQVFFLGLLLGLVLGGGFFVLKLDQYVKELSFYKSLTEGKKDKNDLVTTEVKTDSQKPVVKPHKKDVKAFVVNDSSNSIVDVKSDSSRPAVYNGNNSDDNIVVRQDEQLGEKTYTVVNLDTKSSSDSIKKDLSAGNISVEFWKSPLNYHGYKYMRNKLVLFGYSDMDLVSVSKIDNAVFLKCLTGVFRIEPSADFHQLERVTDESLLARLK